MENLQIDSRNKHRPLIVLVLIGAFVIFSTPIFAATLTLKSGKVIEGTITSRTDKYIKISYQGVELTFYKDEIKDLTEIPIGDSEIYGKKDAPLTIVMFSDFECPYCATAYSLMMEVVAAHPNDVRLVLKQFPLLFHSMARPSAKACLAAAQQNKTYEMAEVLFRHSKDLDVNKFWVYANQAGLNTDQFMHDFTERSNEWEEKIKNDMKLGDEVGVSGTPSYFINGNKVSPGDLKGWDKVIKEYLNKLN